MNFDSFTKDLQSKMTSLNTSLANEKEIKERAKILEEIGAINKILASILKYQQKFVKE